MGNKNKLFEKALHQDEVRSEVMSIVSLIVGANQDIIGKRTHRVIAGYELSITP